MAKFTTGAAGILNRYILAISCLVASQALAEHGVPALPIVRSLVETIASPQKPASKDELTACVVSLFRQEAGVTPASGLLAAVSKKLTAEQSKDLLSRADALHKLDRELAHEVGIDHAKAKEQATRYREGFETYLDTYEKLFRDLGYQVERGEATPARYEGSADGVDLREEIPAAQELKLTHDGREMRVKVLAGQEGHALLAVQVPQVRDGKHRFEAVKLADQREALQACLPKGTTLPEGLRAGVLRKAEFTRELTWAPGAKDLKLALTIKSEHEDETIDHRHPEGKLARDIADALFGNNVEISRALEDEVTTLPLR